MTRNHLRHEGGGYPAQGPASDTANPAPSPAAGEDFPDAPDASDGPVQDQPDLDAFAERLGLSVADAPAEAWNTSKLAETAATKLAVGLGAASRFLASLADRIRPTS